MFNNIKNRERIQENNINTKSFRSMLDMDLAAQEREAMAHAPSPQKPASGPADPIHISDSPPRETTQKTTNPTHTNTTASPEKKEEGAAAKVMEVDCDSDEDENNSELIQEIDRVLSEISGWYKEFDSAYKSSGAMAEIEVSRPYRFPHTMRHLVAAQDDLSTNVFLLPSFGHLMALMSYVNPAQEYHELEKANLEQAYTPIGLVPTEDQGSCMFEALWSRLDLDDEQKKVFPREAMRPYIVSLLWHYGEFIMNDVS